MVCGPLVRLLQMAHEMFQFAHTRPKFKFRKKLHAQQDERTNIIEIRRIEMKRRVERKG